jgi:flavodoxin
MKTAIVYISYHHKNTEKVAREMAVVLGADLKKVGTFNTKELADYDLLGFGSGIYMGKHHNSLLELVANMPASNKKAFILSTSGFNIKKPKPGFHKALRTALQRKGLEIIDEFNCPGYDTYIIVRLLRGGRVLNKGRPNEDDLKKAQIFAKNLINKLNSAAVL